MPFVCATGDAAGKSVGQTKAEMRPSCRSARTKSLQTLPSSRQAAKSFFSTLEMPKQGISSSRTDAPKARFALSTSLRRAS